MTELENVKMMLEQKIKTYENKEKLTENDERRYQRFQLIQELANDRYHSFFNDIDMETSIKILMDLGMNKEDAIERYKRIMSEIIKNKYKIINKDDLKKER